MVMSTATGRGVSRLYRLPAKPLSHKFEFSFLNGNLMVPADPLFILSGAGGEREPPSVETTFRQPNGAKR